MLAALGAGQAAWAQDVADATDTIRLHQVQITATRFGEPVQEVPLPVAIVTGDELRQRGVTDLRGALALLSGVTVAPGGDAGPAGAVPGLLGLREVDDLLLLVDGIPAGGAFIPQFETVSLVNVERIEVLRGSAPVYFGTTAFAGTINVIHYAAGKADPSVTLSYGSHGSRAASGAVVLSDGGVRQSISADLSDGRLSDPRAGAKRAQGTWRLATDAGGGSLRADLSVLGLRQRPTGPTPVDEATGQLTTLLPKDYNQNPADGRINTERYQLVLGYERALEGGVWGSTLSYATTHTDTIRGFIDLGDTPQPWTGDTVADVEAFHQTLRLRDLFIDSHVTFHPAPALDLTAGINLLAGKARAHSLRYAYELQLDGTSIGPPVDSLNPKTDVDLRDDRRLWGLYVQGRYTFTPALSLLAGLRWNQTHEQLDEYRVTLGSGTTADHLYPVQDEHRASGTIGLQWKAWQASQGAVGHLDALTLYASVGNTMQLAQVDFNPSPDARPAGDQLLKPETQRSVTMGVKADAFGGRAEFDIETFFVDFDNQPLLSGSSLTPGGRERYKGIDFENRWHPAAAWTVVANIGYSDIRFRDFVTDIEGTSTQLAGKRLVLSPSLRANAGLVFAPDHGWRGSITTNYTGRHWLDELNTAKGAAYAVVDASLGYRFQHLTVQATAVNLGDRRDAAQTSELGEGQFYRLPGRSLRLSVAMPI